MDLVNVRDLFRKQEDYVDQTVTIGGWVRSIRGSKNFGFIVVTMVLFLCRYRLCTRTYYRTLQRWRS